MNQPEAINSLVKDIHQNAVDHGFWDKSQNVGEKCALAAGELCGEFLERYRKDDNSADEHCPEFSNMEIELADTFIRILDLAGWMGYHRFGECVQAKMLYNRERPYLHGKKF